MISEMADQSLTINNMAALLHIHDPSRISNWKRRGSIPKDMLDPVARVLGVTLQWLMTGEPPKKQVHDIRHAQQVLARRREMAELREPEADGYCTAQWEIDALKALRGMDEDRRRRALQDLEDGAELERLKKVGTR